MSNDSGGLVTVSEIRSVLAQLADMAERAAENGQGMFSFVLSVASESLADNLETACDVESDE